MKFRRGWKMQLGEAEEFWVIVVRVEWCLALKHLKHIPEKQWAISCDLQFSLASRISSLYLIPEKAGKHLWSAHIAAMSG